MNDTLRRLGGRLRRLVGFGKAALVDDTQPQQLIQLQVFVGGAEDLQQVLDQVVRLGEYGFFSVPPQDAEAVVLFPNGDKTGGVIVATGHRASRPKDKAPGEAGIYNGLTDKIFRMGSDGVAYLNCDLVLTDGANLRVAGDITDQTAGGNARTVKNLRDGYNGHHHTDPQGGVTGDANPQVT